MSCRNALPTLFLASVVCAQGTLVVDAAGGSGTYPTVDAALAAANPRDRIQVVARPGTVYPAFTAAIGVSLLGINGPDIMPFTVGNVPSGQSFAAEALNVLPGVIAIHDCVGSVHFEHVTSSCSNPAGCTAPPTLDVQRCILVTANLSDFAGLLVPAVTVTDSAVAFSECSFLGNDASIANGLISAPGMQLTNSDVMLAAGSCFGGSDDGVLPASPGIIATGGLLTITGDVTMIGGGQLAMNAPAIVADLGQLHVDPLVILYPSAAGPTITGSSTLDSTPLPFCVLDVDGIAGLLTATIKSAPSTMCVLALGFPTPPIPFPGLGELWLDPSLVFTAAIAPTDTRGKLVQQYSIPPNQAIIGLVLGEQGAALIATPALSNPAFGIID